jgi:hypothetical protein
MCFPQEIVRFMFAKIFKIKYLQNEEATEVAP